MPRWMHSIGDPNECQCNGTLWIMRRFMSITTDSNEIYAACASLSLKHAKAHVHIAKEGEQQRRENNLVSQSGNEARELSHCSLFIWLASSMSLTAMIRSNAFNVCVPVVDFRFYFALSLSLSFFFSFLDVSTLTHSKAQCIIDSSLVCWYKRFCHSLFAYLYT